MIFMRKLRYTEHRSYGPVDAESHLFPRQWIERKECITMIFKLIRHSSLINSLKQLKKKQLVRIKSGSYSIIYNSSKRAIAYNIVDQLWLFD